MGTNNLRIIYNNCVDYYGSTITPSSTQTAATTAANLLKDTKSLVWRSSPGASSTTVKANLLITIPTAAVIRGIALPFCNLSAAATIRIRGYTSSPPTLGGTVDAPTIVGGTSLFDSGTVLCCPWNTLNLPAWGTNPAGSNVYAYGGGTYARVWLPTNTVAGSTFAVEIIDTYSTAAVRYIEASRVVLGQYWSPAHNVSFGLSSGISDSSTHVRTEAGDLVTRRGTRFSTLNFDLKYLNAADRINMTQILLGNGLPKPIFVSLFPDVDASAANYEKERSHQIYGKFTAMPGSQLDNPFTYSSTVSLEEV